MLPFVKLQGAGNDYIAIDGRNNNYDWNQLSIDMSKPAFGVGSDGIVVVFDSDVADTRMRIYNPDGSEAEISGNGIRLFTKLVTSSAFLLSFNTIISTLALALCFSDIFSNLFLKSDSVYLLPLILNVDVVSAFLTIPLISTGVSASFLLLAISDIS